jgi:hypothetical protein
MRLARNSVAATPGLIVRLLHLRSACVIFRRAARELISERAIIPLGKGKTEKDTLDFLPEHVLAPRGRVCLIVNPPLLIPRRVRAPLAQKSR